MVDDRQSGSGSMVRVLPQAVAIVCDSSYYRSPVRSLALAPSAATALCPRRVPGHEFVLLSDYAELRAGHGLVLNL